MGIFFGCQHKWSKYGRKVNGYQQRRCTKCGRVSRRKVSQFFCSHRWNRDKRRKEGIIVCKKCGKKRQVRKVSNAKL